MSLYTQGIARKKFAGRWNHYTDPETGLSNDNKDVVYGWKYILNIPSTLIKGRKPNQFLADATKEGAFTKFYEFTSMPPSVLAKSKDLVTNYGWHPNDILLSSGLKRKKSGGIIGGIKNVVSDAVKLAVAPVTVIAGKDLKLTTGVGKVVGDSAKIAVSPIKQGVSSITGKPVDLKLQTKAGKVVGGVTDIGGNALHSLAKGFADTVTLGYATKAANLIRKDENKEKAFAYNEMKQLPNTGIKVIDKVGAVLPTVSAAIGGAAAGVMGGTKIADMLKKDSNLKETTVAIGDNVLTGSTPPPNQPINLQAGALPINPLMILGIIAAVIVLVIVAKKIK